MNPISTLVLSNIEARFRDAEAIRRTVEGDSEAFKYLYLTYKTRVYFACLRLSGDPFEAEDLLQETFMLAFRHIASFRGDCRFSTWLFRIATNSALMKLRRLKPRIQEVSFDELQENDGSTRHTGKFESEAGRNDCTDERIQLEHAIRELRPGHKAMFMLHDVHGYKHSEIAEMMGCAVSNTKSQLHRARAKLRRVLTKGRTLSATRNGSPISARAEEMTLNV
jgi:RNA polymerase sigma-70 factor, ECF subfamily